MIPWVCLQFVIVIFPDHTHLPFCGVFIIYCKALYLVIILIRRYLRYKRKLANKVMRNIVLNLVTKDNMQ